MGMYSIENIVNKPVTALYGDNGIWAYRGEHFTMYINTESLGCTFGTNTTSYVSYSLIKKKTKTKLNSHSSCPKAFTNL